jgi:hypothetical protein
LLSVPAAAAARPSAGVRARAIVDSALQELHAHVVERLREKYSAEDGGEGDAAASAAARAIESLSVSGGASAAAPRR